MQFIKWFDKYNQEIPLHKLDMLLELTGREVKNILLPINRYLATIKIRGEQHKPLPAKYKYLLQKADLSAYLTANARKDLFEGFFDLLQEVQDEDPVYIKWLLGLYRKTSRRAGIVQPANQPPESDNTVTQPCEHEQVEINERERLISPRTRIVSEPITRPWGRGVEDRSIPEGF